MYRQILDFLSESLAQSKPPIILILGMRQVGKSTLAKALVERREYKRFNFDIVEDRKMFIRPTQHELDEFYRQNQGKVVVVDEVQKVDEATGVIKHLYDSYGMKFVLTGSSELKVRRQVGDTLTGRLREVRLYPLSLAEINLQSGLTFDRSKEYNNYDQNQVETLRYLVYGSLPQLRNIPSSAHREYLDDMVNNLLSKEVLEISGIRRTNQIYSLAKMLAFQIGQLVNFNELAGNLETSRDSVYRYLEIMEQLGIIVRAQPISTNMRESIAHKTKIYFTDLGIRNSLVGNFSEIGERPDRGQILENAVFMGIKRQMDYARIRGNLGFFRSAYGTEIDIVKKVGDQEELFEVKFKDDRKRRKTGVEIITQQTAQKYLY